MRSDAEAAAASAESVAPVEPVSVGTNKAVEYLVAVLSPKERACVLLKDVYDYSLEEIAELVDSTVGGVKAALSRGRARLGSSAVRSRPARPPDPELLRIMRLYVDCFNRQDWDTVRDLVSADAQLRVADRFAGRFADSPYFVNYAEWPWPWRLEMGELDGETTVIIHRQRGESWVPHSAIRLGRSGSERT